MGAGAFWGKHPDLIVIREISNAVLCTVIVCT